MLLIQVVHNLHTSNPPWHSPTNEPGTQKGGAQKGGSSKKGGLCSTLARSLPPAWGASAWPLTRMAGPPTGRPGKKTTEPGGKGQGGYKAWLVGWFKVLTYHLDVENSNMVGPVQINM